MKAQEYYQCKLGSKAITVDSTSGTAKSGHQREAATLAKAAAQTVLYKYKDVTVLKVLLSGASAADTVCFEDD